MAKKTFDHRDRDRDRTERAAPPTTPDLSSDEFAILGRYLGLGAGFLLDKTETAEKVKSWFNTLFGGKEDSFLAIEMLTALSPLIPGGRFTDEILENFVRYSGHAIREYGRDGKRDPAMLEKHLEFAEKLAKEDVARAAHKKDFFMALAAMPPDDFRLAREFFYAMRDDEIERDLPDGTSVLVYDHLQKLGREREAQPEQLRTMIAHLRDGRAEEAYEEIVRLLNGAPLINPPAPPAKPKKAAVIDKVMVVTEKIVETVVKDVEEIFTGNAKPKDVSYTVVRGDTIEKIAKAHKVSERLIISTNKLGPNKPLRLGMVLTIPGLSEFFAKVDQEIDQRAALLK